MMVFNQPFELLLLKNTEHRAMQPESASFLPAPPPNHSAFTSGWSLFPKVGQSFPLTSTIKLSKYVFKIIIFYKNKNINSYR